MPASAYQIAVRSNPDTDFTEALATNEASATVDLRLPTRDPLWFIRAISIVSVQNLAWEVMLFTSADNMGATLQTDRFLGTWQFGAMTVGPPAYPGWPIDTPETSPDNGYYHFYIDGNMMPYYDMDQMAAQNPYSNVPLGVGVANASPNNAKLHIRLINRSAASKSADAAGALLLTIYCANQGMQV